MSICSHITYFKKLLYEKLTPIYLPSDYFSTSNFPLNNGWDVKLIKKWQLKFKPQRKIWLLEFDFGVP